MAGMYGHLSLTHTHTHTSTHTNKQTQNRQTQLPPLENRAAYPCPRDPPSKDGRGAVGNASEAIRVGHHIGYVLRRFTGVRRRLTAMAAAPVATITGAIVGAINAPSRFVAVAVRGGGGVRSCRRHRWTVSVSIPSV